MFGSKRALVLIPLLAVLLLGAAGWAAKEDATPVTASPVATLVDVASEVALIDAGDLVVYGGLCSSQICFGLNCDGRPSGFVCNPVSHCRCSWCNGVFDCRPPLGGRQ